MSHLDLPYPQALPLISSPKWAPATEWQMIGLPGKIEKWQYAVGLVVTGQENTRSGLVMQLNCLRSIRPLMSSYQFGMFYREHGAMKRVYMLESSTPALGVEGDHDWPHEHWGQDRINIPVGSIPLYYPDVLSKFLTTCSIDTEEPIPDPFEFRLKP